MQFTEYAKTMWSYAFEAKEKGRSNDYIYNGLLKKGVDEDYAFMLVKSLETKVKEFIDNFDTTIIIGWVIVFAGTVLLFLGINEPTSGMFISYGLLILCGGLSRVYKGSTNKKKYLTVYDSILQENMDSTEDKLGNSNS